MKYINIAKISVLNAVVALASLSSVSADNGRHDHDHYHDDDSSNLTFEYPLDASASVNTLKLAGISCDIEFVHSDSNAIVLSIKGANPVPEKAKGLRPLFSSGKDNTGLGLELSPAPADAEGAEGVLILSQAKRDPGDTLVVAVPAQITVDVEVHMHYDVEFHGVQGGIVVNSLNGDIELTDVSGPLLVNTTNGDVDVTFASLNTELSSSIKALNGEIDVELKGDEQISFKLSTMHGEIYTDLDLEIDDKKGNMNRLIGNRDMTAKLNGGGVQMEISSLNGEIFLRKAE